jgi:asparagine synthase (glutamine-hydrolysing)
MCGIAGIFYPSSTGDAAEGILRQMLAMLEHRGPDGVGCYLDDSLAMGTTRLSIISPLTGTQPMSDATGRYWLCYSGELYNYRELKQQLRGTAFETESDTEVVLKSWIHWGEKCLSRFNGAFAFALWDSVAQRLYLARDRFGKRPLYYTSCGGELLFASEMKAFLAAPDFEFQFDEAQLASIYAIWTPLPEETGFRRVHQIPPGAFLRVDAAGHEIQIWNRLELEVEPFPGTAVEAQHQIRETFLASVKSQLQSDVPSGVYLSGGLDSAILTYAAASLASKPVRTFSVGFEDQKFDESQDQAEVARFLETEHRSISVSSGDIAGNFPAAVFHAEVPAFRTAFVPMFLLSQYVRRCGVKMVLTGEGADELFLGYDLFKETLMRAQWRQLSPEARKERLAKLYPWLDHFSQAGPAHLLGLFEQFAEERMPGLFSHELRFQNGRFAARLIANCADPFKGLADLIDREPGYASLKPTEKAQFLEFKTLLAGYLLSTQGDRMSFGHGVENRCPFLDPDLFRLASSVNLRFDDGITEKLPLREAFRGDIPEQIFKKPKFPYRAPDSAAFVKSRPEYLELLLSESELSKAEFLDQKFARGLVRKLFKTAPEQISTREDQAFVLLLSTMLLHRNFVRRIDLPVSLNRVPVVKMVDRRQALQAAE